MSVRRRMQVGDWGNAAINGVIGVFLGVATDGLVQLVTTAFWPLAVVIPFLFAGLFPFIWVFDKLTDRVFPSEVRPARQPRAERRTPLPRLLSLPAGLALGVALARLGLGKAILGVISSLANVRFRPEPP